MPNKLCGCGDCSKFSAYGNFLSINKSTVFSYPLLQLPFFGTFINPLHLKIVTPIWFQKCIAAIWLWCSPRGGSGVAFEIKNALAAKWRDHKSSVSTARKTAPHTHTCIYKYIYTAFVQKQQQQQRRARLGWKKSAAAGMCSQAILSYNKILAKDNQPIL